MDTSTAYPPVSDSRLDENRDLMGRSVVPVQIANVWDRALAERGVIPSSDVRSVRLESVLVDTGATRLCLPADVVQLLGLKTRGLVSVHTAAGKRKARVCTGLELTVLGRTGLFDCLELPAGTQPLLGQIPLEDLGLQPDMQTRKLNVLPDQGDETYLTA